MNYSIKEHTNKIHEIEGIEYTVISNMGQVKHYLIIRINLQYIVLPKVLFLFIYLILTQNNHQYVKNWNLIVVVSMIAVFCLTMAV